MNNIPLFMVFNEKNKNLVKVSLRSKNEYNFSKFAAQFGGGGHPKAAGITIEGNLKSVVERVIQALQESLVN